MTVPAPRGCIRARPECGRSKRKLVGTGAIGPAPTHQGSSVSISADANTAIVGGLQDNSGAGAAWVYTRSTSGVWIQQAKLVGTGAIDSFGSPIGSSGSLLGFSVSISADGNVAIVGGPGDNLEAGAAWVYTRSAGVWTQQAKLVGTDTVDYASQGFDVSISADGNTVIVGGPGDEAAWVGPGRAPQP